MIRSFLNVFLPNDEYKRLKMVYIMAEAAFLTASILILFSLFNLNWLNLELDADLIIFFIFAFLLFYVFLRYIFSGIEHTEVYNQQDFIKKRKKGQKSALKFGLIFFVVLFFFKGIPSSWIEVMDVIGPAILAALFHYLFDYISLKRSYKKNKELLDD